MLMQTLALDLAPHNIQVNEVAPGYVDAGLSAQMFRARPGLRDLCAQRVPLRRLMEADDVAREGLAHLGDGPTWVAGENRAGFDARGPGLVPAPRAFPPDASTRAVLDLVAARFTDHPGSLDRFDWPVTPAEAEVALAAGNRVERRREHVLARVLLDVIEAMEGKIFLNECLFYPENCGRSVHCKVHRVWQKAREGLRRTLAVVTLDQLHTLEDHAVSRRRSII